MFDLDGTLTDSKQPLTSHMAACLRDLLGLLPVAITTGGTWDLVEQQVLDHLEAPERLLEQLHLLPACGTRAYERVDGAWVRRYARDLSPAQKTRIERVLLSAAADLGVLVADPWGEVIEDRGGQVTYSVLGQQAPSAAKEAWDPDGSIREVLRRLVQERLPDLAVRTGRSTSVDVTTPGVDKAYGVARLARSLGLRLSAVTYVGDRLGPGGNDESVRRLDGVVCVQVTGWPQTAAWVEALVARTRHDGPWSATIPAAQPSRTTPREPPMNVDAQLLEILVCPACRATLTVDDTADELVCNGCGLAYPVRDDIPVMLVDEARRPRAGAAPDDPPERPADADSGPS